MDHEPGSVPRPSFQGYYLSEPSLLTSHHQWSSSNDLRGSSSHFVQKDMRLSRPAVYGLNDIAGMGVHPEHSIGGLATGGIKDYPTPLQDPNLLHQRQDAAVRISTGFPDLINERAASLRKVDGLPVTAAGESNILFVDGLPDDCSRREVGHLFRPFIGFKDIRVVHKEPRRKDTVLCWSKHATWLFKSLVVTQHSDDLSGDKAMVLCFVEFNDVQCALTALDALQGYKFDDKKPDSPVLRIHFAHFPFRLPSHDDNQRIGVP